MADKFAEIPATLNNGLNIQVPPFVESGDEVIIDTRNLEYEHQKQ